MFRVLYYVLLEDTEATVAICDNRSIAEWICDNFPQKCVVRTTITR